MTDTLFDAVLQTARVMGEMATGTATGGSKTTIIDTVNRVESDDHWNGGTALIVTDAGGASAAPQGEWGYITDFTSSSATFTISTLSTAVAAGDVYAAIPPRFSLDRIRNAINTALSGILIPAFNSTALDTADNQTEYTLPAAVTRNNLRQVWYQTNTDDADDNEWYELRDWYVIKKGTGTQDVLVLPQLTASRDIMLIYMTSHGALQDADDQINEAVHLDRIKFRAAELLSAREIAWEDNYNNAGPMANYYADKADRADIMYPVHEPKMNGRIKSYSFPSGDYSGVVGKVRL